MPFASSEADRLNHFLDARVQGRQVDPEDLDPTLVDAYERVRAMDARSAPDPQLMTNLWRTMMSTIPAEMRNSPRGVAPVFPVRHWLPERRRWSLSGALAAAFGLVALLLAGTIGYLQFTNRSDPDMPTTIPAAFQDAGTPTATGCETTPREPGSIAEILESPQTRQPFLPRFGFDPVYGPGQDRQTANGDSLLMNSAADDSFSGPITAALQELVDCRFYSLDRLGEIDMEGRYFALYSDDYFRRELSGYEDAGMPLVLVSYWAPPSMPEVVETRRITDNQVLAVLNMRNNEPEGTLVINFVNERGRWLVDEVGFADMIDADASPVPPMPSTPGPGTWVDRYPLLQEIAIHDIDPAATPVGMSDGLDSTICGPLDQGTPVSCEVHFQRMGPYPLTEYPANTDFTIVLYNLGDQSKRLEIGDLGIVVELEPGGSNTLNLNADPGEYLFTIYQSDLPDPVAAGVFTFISPDGPPPAMG